MWVRQGSSTTKRFIPYQPEFCLKSDQEPLEVAERLLAKDQRVESMRRDRTRLWLRGPLHDVLRVKPKRMQDTWAVARDLRRLTKTKGFLFFDVDHSQESRWMHSQGLWSMCRLKTRPQPGQPGAADEALLERAEDEDRWTHDYPDPGLRTVRLAVEAQMLGHQPAFTDPLVAIHFGEAVLHCERPGDPESERAVLRALGRLLHDRDPDVLTTQGGDQFDIPYLLHRIQALGLGDRVWLGRDPDPLPEKPDQAAKSIHTYGRWLYKSHAYYLRGRWHIDLSKKTLDSEDDREDLHGILYLARVSNRRAQDVARNGAGFALQQMQVDLAVDLGVALPWKRNLTEDWKDVATLHAVDRGSQIMVPTPGIYGDVVACDFSGYYPALVVAHNLSSDSLNCQCCPDGPIIPELGYHVCQKHLPENGGHYGHQAEILRRLAPHRKWARAVLKKAKRPPAQGS
ncbi:MAG: polymerase [Thermoplasmata archaeon]|nr:polymerase [Thermoplasmata archaeon]